MIDLSVVERLRGMQRVRATRLEQEGFTPKQAAFLLMVLEHSGVFVERQYCAYAGITHGQKTHDFLRRLTGSGLAREVRPGALHRGRFYHVRHKRLYAAVGQENNRNRRAAPIGALVSRLMLLDLVLDEPSRLWLGTSREKRLYFTELHTQRRLDDVDLPHLRYGAGRDKVLRLFPDKLPIGTMTQDPDAHLFTYLVTRRDPVDFRAFLQRHHWLLCFGGPWTLRVALPRPFHGLEGRYRAVIRDELFAPMEFSALQELEWYCGERLRREADPSPPRGGRFAEAERLFRSAKCANLYRQYKQRGGAALTGAVSRVLLDKLQRNEAQVEFVPLKRQYLHLAPLVGVA